MTTQFQRAVELPLCLAVSSIALASLPAAAQPAQSVELLCTRTSAVPSEAGSNWVKYFDLKIDLSTLSVDKTTTLNDGERHETFRNGEVESNDAFTRTGVVSVEPDVVQFGYDVVPKGSTESFHALSTIDRTTGQAVDNLSQFQCKLTSAQHLF